MRPQGTEKGSAPRAEPLYLLTLDQSQQAEDDALGPLLVGAVETLPVVPLVQERLDQ